MKRVLMLLLLIVVTDAYSDQKKSYLFGVVPQYSPKEIADIWLPLLKEVSNEVGVEFVLEAAPSIPEFEKAFQAGKYDLAYMNPYHLLLANRSQQYHPILRDDNRQLRGIVVVRKESPINAIQDLNGKKVAFPAPNALGASLIPRAEFARNYQINIDPLYVKSHSSVYLNVVMGLVEAGGGVMKTLNSQPDSVRDNLRVLYTTTAVPSHPIAVHPRIDHALQKKITQAFLKLNDTPAGRALLDKIPISRIGSAHLRDYQAVESMGLDEFYVREGQ